MVTQPFYFGCTFSINMKNPYYILCTYMVDKSCRILYNYIYEIANLQLVKIGKIVEKQ